MGWERARWAAVVAIASLSAACGGGDEPEAADVPPAAVAPTPDAGAAAPAAGAGDLVQQGQQVFAGSGLCFSCHGSDGSGSALGPDLTDDQWLWVDPAAGDVQTQLTTIIRTGVSVPKEHPAPMPAMGGGQLTDAQLEAVSAYVYSLAGQG